MLLNIPERDVSSLYHRCIMQYPCHCCAMRYPCLLVGIPAWAALHAIDSCKGLHETAANATRLQLLLFPALQCVPAAWLLTLSVCRAKH
jgi:hypothetical protein